MQLAGRDRQMLALAAVLIVAWLGWLFWVGPWLERAARTEEQIAHKGKQLEELVKLRASWDRLQAERATLEERLGRRGKGFSLSAALPALSSRAGITKNVKGITESPAVQEGRYRRRVAEVALEKLTLDQLVGYLYEVENPRGMLRVERLEVRPRVANPIYLDASLTVSALEVVAK